MLAPLSQLQQPSLRDVQVIRHVEFSQRLKDEVPGLELEEEIESLPGAARPPAFGVDEASLLEAVQPAGPVRSSKGKNACVPLPGDLLQELQEPGAVNELERDLGLGRFDGVRGGSAAAE